MTDQTMRIFLAYRFDGTQARPIDISDGNGGQLSLPLTPEQFVHRVKYHLSKQANLEPFCYAGEKDDLVWDEIIKNQLATCDKLVLFWSGMIGKTQSIELQDWKEYRPDSANHTVLVQFSKRDSLPDEYTINLSSVIKLDSFYEQSSEDLSKLDRTDRERYARHVSDWLASKCAECIFVKLGMPPKDWIPCDGLPVGYPFDYEKGIIREFVYDEKGIIKASEQDRGRLLSPTRLQQGCPLEWPQVARVTTEKDPYHNPIPELITGKPRLDTDTIIVDGRSQYHKDGQQPDACCLMRLPRPLSFIEAGPREKIVHPLKDDLRIGIVVSGGIAPGINAVIAGICSRHIKYQEEYEKRLEHEREHGIRRDEVTAYKLSTVIYRDGFFGMLQNYKIELKPSEVLSQVNTHANLGGSWIGTARHDDLLDSNNKAERNEKLDDLINILVAKDCEIDILYVIGGEGTMRAAHAIATRARQRWLSGSIDRQISVVGVPKTMDNDILWVWQAFGFLSAVEKAKEFISQLATEAKSNPRLCIVQLFGSDSGFVVSHAGLASGVCKAALIPEVEFTMKALSKYIREQCLHKDMEAKKDKLGQSPCGIILLAETAIPSDVEDYIDNPDYPDLQLTEEEKKAIRSYIGSALLNCSESDCPDIKPEDWPAFLAAIADDMPARASSLRKRICGLLPRAVRNIIEGYKRAKEADSNEEVPFEIRSLITRSLNFIIRNEDLAESEDATPTTEPPSQTLRNLSRYTQFVRKCAEMQPDDHRMFEYLLHKRKIMSEDRDNPLEQYPEPERILQALESYPISHKARTAIGLLKDRMSEGYLLEKVVVGNRDNYPLSDEAKKKVKEIVNRMSDAGIKDAAESAGGAALAQWMNHFTGYNTDLYAELRRAYNRLLMEEVFTRNETSAERQTSTRHEPLVGYIRRLSTAGERRVHGQTPDGLRSGGLRVVSAVLQQDIRHKMRKNKDYWEHFRVFVNEPRHLIRAIPPSVSDIIFGQRLGVLAVDNAMAGYTDFMVSQWVTEYVLVPLELVVLGRKRVPQNGIFWKSVLQNTGQPATMV